MPDTTAPAVTANPGAPVITAPEIPAMPADDNIEDDCGRQQLDVRRKPAEVLLVLDRSGSMQDKPKKTPTTLRSSSSAQRAPKSKPVADTVNIIFACNPDELL